jgi:hypothetical protein
MNWVARPESSMGVVDLARTTPFADSGRATHAVLMRFRRALSPDTLAGTRINR